MERRCDEEPASQVAGESPQDRPVDDPDAGLAQLLMSHRDDGGVDLVPLDASSRTQIVLEVDMREHVGCGVGVVDGVDEVHSPDDEHWFEHVEQDLGEVRGASTGVAEGSKRGRHVRDIGRDGGPDHLTMTDPEPLDAVREIDEHLVAHGIGDAVDPDVVRDVEVLADEFAKDERPRMSDVDGLVRQRSRLTCDRHSSSHDALIVRGTR